MSEAKFTKGEWTQKVTTKNKLVKKITVASSDKGKKTKVCEVVISMGSDINVIESKEANAHLIAAAPEMYAMLCKIKKAQESIKSEVRLQDFLFHLHDDMETLLRKARGEV